MTPIEQLGAFAGVPITLEAELARQTIRLEELLALHPGSFIPLAAAPTKEVVLCAGRVLLARGEITQTGTRAAVRLSSVPAGA